MTSGSCKASDTPGSGNFPVTGVSHIDAEAYATWLSAQTGATWRRPTDTEWAYAAAARFRSDIEGVAGDPKNPALRWLAQYRTEAAPPPENDKLFWLQSASRLRQIKPTAAHLCEPQGRFRPDGASDGGRTCSLN